MQKYLKEIKILLKITIPIILSQISQMSIGFINNFMIRHFKESDIASISIGTSIWFPVILFGHGLLLSLVPIISRMHGSKNIRNIPKQITNAYWLATLISIIIMIVLWNSNIIIKSIHHINPEIEKQSIKYIRILLWSTPGYLYFQVIQNQCEGLLKTKPAMFIGIIGLLLNVILNYIFMSGYCYYFNYGSMSCGISSIIVYWFMFLAMKIVTKQDKLVNYNTSNGLLKKKHLKLYLPNLKIIFNLFKIGIPIAFALFFEVILFTIITLFIASMGEIQIISQQISLNISSIIFILPLSIGTATSIRLGYYLGKKSFHKISTTILSSQIIGLILAIIISTLIILFNHQIITLYTKNKNVIELSKKITFIIASYQIFDFFQIIGNGILRSYKDTNAIFIITILSYWIIGFPCGYILAHTNYITSKMEIIGFWIGIFISLTISSILILFRIHTLKTKQIPT